MTIRKQLSDKVFVLGVDGLDPRYSKKMLREGKMPNLQKYIDRGAAREDLMLLGGHPTVTPPMWATLAAMPMCTASPVFTASIPMICPQ